MSAAVAAVLLDGHLPAERRPLRDAWRARALAEGAAFLRVHLAALPRRIGRERATGGIVLLESGVAVVAESLRLCDLAAADLLEAAGVASDAEILQELWTGGDAEERCMLLKALPFLAPGEHAVRLLREAHRSNDAAIFQAGFADGDLAAFVLDDDDYARALLKAAFVDLPLERLLGAERRATTSLSRMLLDFMSEREAAHRPVWAGSLELAAHAPCPGVLARVAGDVWSGVDARRLSAAKAAAILAAPALVPSLADRLPLERHPAVRAALEHALAVIGRA